MNKFVKFLLVASIGMVGAISPTLGQSRGPSMMDEGGMMNQDGQGQRMMRRGMKAEEGINVG